MSKTILITGAETGLGKGAAIGLAKNGHKVIATVRDWPQVTLLKEEASTAGVDLIIEKLEYSNENDHETVIRKYGEKIDIFVANAATGETGPAAEIPMERFRYVFEINVFQTLALTQKIAAMMVKKGSGKIIGLSSIAGLMTFPYLSPYVASKHAIEAIFQTMHGELQPLGVQVALINPAAYNTGFNNRMFDTVDQWFDPKKNFTPEKPIRDMQEMLANPGFQLDPQEMIDAMINIIPKDTHKFHTIVPEEHVLGLSQEYHANLKNTRVTL